MNAELSKSINYKLVNNIRLTKDELDYTEKLYDGLSYYNYGYIYDFYQLDRKDNVEKSVEMYEKAAELGEYIAMRRIGHFYETGKYSYKKNLKIAVEYYEKAANLGDSQSMLNLGYMYVKGLHPDGKNLKKALEFYIKAAELGEEIALFNVGIIHYHDGNPEESFKWFEKAVEKGKMPDALQILGNMYNKGKYTDHEKYLELYTKYSHSKPDLPKPKKKLKKLFQTLDDECCICYESLLGCYSGICILQCGHVFHSECLKLTGNVEKCSFNC